MECRAKQWSRASSRQGRSVEALAEVSTLNELFVYHSWFVGTADVDHEIVYAAGSLAHAAHPPRASTPCRTVATVVRVDL